MWKFLNESVEGTSHQSSGIPCQDASFVSPYVNGDEELLILVCSDGAGSAKESRHGSTHACKQIAGIISEFIDGGHLLGEVDESLIRDWLRKVHSSLREEAVSLALTPRDLACTFLLSIAGRQRSVFAQVGDGAIVIADEDKLATVFWPQNGDYQNTTYFITDDEFEKRVEVRIFEKPIDQIAMFTDGIQMLALNYAAKGVHEPFFRPMLQSLSDADDRQDLIAPLRQFLNSPGVNSRTDDDKTLILATWVTSVDATV